MRDRIIISVLPKRETCDNCIYGTVQDSHKPLYCDKHEKEVSWKGWCKNYCRLPIGIPASQSSNNSRKLEK